MWTEFPLYQKLDRPHSLVIGSSPQMEMCAVRKKCGVTGHLAFWYKIILPESFFFCFLSDNQKSININSAVFIMFEMLISFLEFIICPWIVSHENIVLWAKYMYSTL